MPDPTEEPRRPRELPELPLHPPFHLQRPQELKPGLHGWEWTVPAEPVVGTHLDWMLPPAVVIGIVAAWMELWMLPVVVLVACWTPWLWIRARAWWRGPVQIRVDEAANVLRITQGRRTWEASLPLDDWERTRRGMRLLGARLLLDRQDVAWLVGELGRPRTALPSSPPPPELERLRRSRQGISG